MSREILDRAQVEKDRTIGVLSETTSVFLTTDTIAGRMVGRKPRLHEVIGVFLAATALEAQGWVESEVITVGSDKRMGYKLATTVPQQG